MNIKLKIKFYKLKGHNHQKATELAIEDAQKSLNDMDEKLAKAFDMLSNDQIKEIMGDMNQNET